MSVRTIKLIHGTSLATIIDIATQNLSMQGYDVKSQVMGPCAAEIIVTKDREGIKNSILGLGLESRVAITVSDNVMTLSMGSEWTNKVVALIIGWFLCWVPVITGIVGLINQSCLPDKIFTAFNLAANSGADYVSQDNATPVDFTPVDPEE